MRNQPKPKRENNINGRWSSYFTGTILCSCSVLFPNSEQNAIFEIGGSQIQYGPYTTGGAINMVSTQIPRRFSGRVTASIGSFNTKKPMSILVTNIKTMVTY
jgi:hypothetical protein